ncbi:MAG: pantoate--beta-alanine ligase [Bacteroidetes bacterium]|nr:pantoate--beta-alanine ligase [Bacteroidota bacterium]
MRLFELSADMQKFSANVRAANLTLGLVPTMGALHAGHLSIVEKALGENDRVAVSIFVNPTQFNNPEDLQKYPRVLDEDLQKLEGISQNRLLVFAPLVKEIYGDNLISDRFDLQGLDLEMEGKYRPGHFQGVATIVKKLFQITKPHKAYFGEKDYQQLAVIRKMTQLEQMPVEIVPCNIYREKNGLAMSSRNRLLSPATKETAGYIFSALQWCAANFDEKEIDELKAEVGKKIASDSTFALEYFEIAEADSLQLAEKKEENKKYRAFIAVFAENVRLIDNIALN